MTVPGGVFRSMRGPASAGTRSAARRRVRVALVGEYPIAEDAIHAGGIQSVTHGLAHALARRDDIECHVVCATAGVNELERQVGPLTVHFVRRTALPRLATNRLHDVPRLVQLIRYLEPDVVHGQGQDRHGLAAVRSGFPTVVTPHGVIFVESRLLRRHALDAVGGLKKYLLDRTEREVFDRAKDMIIISPYLPRIYGRMLSARPHLIENPINEAFFSLERAPEPGRLLFAGTVVPRKRVEDLVYAVAALRRSAISASSPLAPGSIPGAPAGLGSAATATAGAPGVPARGAGDLAGASGSGVRQPDWFPRLQLRIAGPLVDRDSEARVRGAIAEQRLEQSVTLLGAVSQTELYEEYRRAQVLVLASREETSPQIIAQAMACGLPIVASRAGGVPDMVRDGEEALLFPIGNIDTCAAQIRRLLDETGFREAMGYRIREAAGRRFHPDAVAEQTVGVYREMLGGDHPLTTG
ncbi:MAG: glycosyltransferase family 4 protein [Candidatus Eisenbacteria sp.]|nr:glycosyltransferase family 4 protein [Candidatus Eisenbacteria bacterium]